MARPKKPVNYEEELEKIDMRIEKHKNTIVELEEEKNRLLLEKKNAEVSSLYDALIASGKTVEDIVSLLKAEGA